MPLGNADIDAIQRALRDVNRVPDETAMKTLKGILERQVRIFTRLHELEAEVAALKARASAPRSE